MPKANPLVDGEFRAAKVAGPNAAVRKRVHGSRMFEGSGNVKGNGIAVEVPAGPWRIFVRL